MNLPLVSIIIPLYNQASFLKDAVNSIIAQTYKNIEIIIINDGSTDNAIEACELLVNDNKSASIIIENQENGGPSSARNKGLSLAKGEYCAFLDADDFLSPEHLQREVGFLETHHEYDIVYCAGQYSGDKKLIERRGIVWKDLGENNQLFRLVELGNVILIHSALFRSKILDNVGTFDTSLRLLEDWDFWLRCAEKGYKFFYMKDLFVQYRIHSENTTGSQIKITKARVQVLKTLLNWDSFTIDQKVLIKDRLVEAYLGLSAREITFDKKKALSYAGKAWMLKKASIRGIVYLFCLVVIPKNQLIYLLGKYIPTLKNE